MPRGLAIFVSLAGLAYAQSSPPPPLTLGERAKIYTGATFGPLSLLTSAMGAGVNQWRDIPTEWGQGGGAYGRRLGSSVAVDLASNAMQFGVSALLHEDVRYTPSHDRAFWHRARYIIVHTYVIQKENGQQAFAWSRVVGAFTSGFVSNLWYPPSANTPGEALIRSGWAFASNMGTSAFQEFWPDVRRKLFHH